MPKPTREARVLIVQAEFNREVTEALRKGAEQVLAEQGIRQIEHLLVHGAWEIPMALKAKLRSRPFDFAVAVGAVIKGETQHHHYLSSAVLQGLMDVMLEQKIPIGLGVLTVENREQAIERAGGKKGNYGANAAKAALKLWESVRMD